MEQAIAHKLPAFLTSIQSNTALIFGLLDTFYDEQASLREVQQILHRLLGSFQKMKASGVSLLLACSERKVEPQERNQLFTTLKTGVDRVYKLDTDEHGAMKLFLESQRVEQLPRASHLIKKGEYLHGTNRTNLHKSDRRGVNKLVKISPRTPQRRSGSV
jgi:hypothetical protein